jgi:His-Xaa-Ser system radical SAM maturase HxsC
MRSLRATLNHIDARQVCRVIALDTLANEWQFDLRFLVPIVSTEQYAELQRLHYAGLRNVIACVGNDMEMGSIELPTVIIDLEHIQQDDVVALSPDRAELIVLYRSSDLHHAVQLTNRCNSNCLMCSQPPTKHNDDWLIEEACQIAAHLEGDPRSIGLTGGEPLLLGAGLRRVIDAFISRHPNVAIDVLTNGRLLSDRNLAASVLDGITGKISWLVPLYGHADFLHDFIVQSPGAFEETIDGLLTLQAYGQPIQLRIVLIEPVLQHLPELCRFIGRNLPFVREVALMGCEPIGFALANRSVCEVDLSAWHAQLQESAAALRRAQIPAVLMNAPFCALPRELWPLASNSISDWKRAFPAECETCTLKSNCSGLFAWYERGWRPTAIKPIREDQL